jgi:hypothetical protein
MKGSLLTKNLTPPNSGAIMLTESLSERGAVGTSPEVELMETWCCFVRQQICIVGTSPEVELMETYCS